VISVGLIGYGYWGPNLARNLARSKKLEHLSIADQDPSRREEAARSFPSATVVDGIKDLLKPGGPDAIAIATPLSTHFELAMEALAAGRHVLIEKPIAASAEEAAQLIEFADKQGLTLMVDHTFIYSSPVSEMARLVERNALGSIHYFDSVRVNLGLFQHDTNVLWDLAVHDVSIMEYVLPQRPIAVSATGLSNLPNQHENVAFMTLFFEGDRTIGHVHVNWLAPAKIRQTVLCGREKMVVYDDLQPAEPIRIYNKGVDLVRDPDSVRERLVSYRVGDVLSPHLKAQEPLGRCIDHYLDCIETQAEPITSGAFGLSVVQVIEAAEKSLKRRGECVEIDR
jgi:predicted dehydrogenase